MSSQDISDNIAVYIDGDNASYKDFSYVYEEIKKYGRIIIGRIYGDWTKTEMKGWKNISINYAFESVNCFSLSKKNSTDIYLICDILQDLYKNQNINTYIIVSSDSDYSHVTKRIRAEGKKVFGIGKKNTPIMLKNACDIFIANEVIKNQEESDDEFDDTFISEKYRQITKDNEDLLNILKAFKGNKKIVISKLKYNLGLLCDVKKIYGSEFRFFEQHLIQNYSNYFRVIENNKTINIINIIDILETINNIFELSDKEDFNLSLIKDKLLIKDPTFDQRSYGYSSMKDFIENVFMKEFEIIKKNLSYYIKKIEV
jgi:uncharacterized protein (TIGR00288 family)